MATLQSPGVQVTVINESFYTPAAPGTVPLIFVASASNKTNPSGVAAAGTTAANAGKVYLITSQRDLVDTFGTPLFYTDANGNPIHGGELNEYGLQAAYSLLGVSSAAYVVRAPIDLASLTANSSTPAGAVSNGSYWVDTNDSKYGVFEWSATKGTFTNKEPLVIDSSNSAQWDSIAELPKASFGTLGSYGLVFNQTATAVVDLFFKNANGNWVKVGTRDEANLVADTVSQNTFESTTWATSWPTVLGKAVSGTIATTTGTSLTINGDAVSISNGDTVQDVAATINDSFHATDGGGGIGAKVIGNALAIYVDPEVQSSIVITISADLVTKLGITAGTYMAPGVFVGPHTQYPDFSDMPSGSIYIKTTNPNAGASWVVKQWSSTANSWNTVKSPIYASTDAATYYLDKVGGGANIPVGTLFVESNFTHGDGTTGPILGEFKVKRRVAVSPTTITGSELSTTSTSITGSLTIEATKVASVGFFNSFTLTLSGASLEDFVTFIVNNAGDSGVQATYSENEATGKATVSIIHPTGGELRFTDPNGVLAQAGLVVGTTANLYAMDPTTEPDMYLASNWKDLTFSAKATAPTTTPANDQLWYSSIVDQVDIMVHNGTTWKGYKNVFPDSDPAGPIVSATKPTTQSDNSALVNGDIWISTADLERYGQDIYVYDGNALQWVLQDVADNTSPTGWLFGDARWGASGDATEAADITDLLESDYLDPDAPDPALYPRGMRLFNLRRSGFNVKKFVTNHINILANDGKNLRYNDEDMTNYNANRWVSVSPNNADGSGSFGRKAQRSFVVAAFKALIDGNQAVRDTDTLSFNLIATPGYPESIQNMIALNVDRGLTAFVVGDTSMRLKPTGTDLQAYGLNTNGAFDNGDQGLVSYNEYMGVFYPSGFTNDLSGNFVVVPPSHMMLRTIAVSDQKSYPWFAPAGIRRGVVDNATSVGYLENGEFKTTALPQSIRDVMARVKINPIATITGAGIINFGQYTRANAASALDRINVARLVAYLRRQLDILARPFLFEPNDKITRNEIKNAVQKLLLELVGQRALYDFIVVCDESNNTPARIDRSELWVDVAIEPVKAVEFIYIPVRLVNTGAIKAGSFTLA